MLEKDEENVGTIDWSDIEIRFTKGSGPGGQHKNKTETKVILTHIPTGISATWDSRSQSHNKEMAYKTLCHRVRETSKNDLSESLNETRRSQIGTGLRSEKIRTIHMKDNWVKCEVTGKKMSWRSYQKGYLDKMTA